MKMKRIIAALMTLIVMDAQAGEGDIAFGGLIGGISGLLIHEAAHVLSIEGSGGEFIGFDAPYNGAIPTLWMEGTRSQVGLSAMMGNNSMLLLSDKMSNSGRKLNDFEQGLFNFATIHPIVYAIRGVGDFETSSEALGVDKDMLRLVVWISALDKALGRGIAPNRSRSVLDISRGEILIEHHGRISSRQQYKIFNTEELYTDLSVGKSGGGWAGYIGEITKGLDTVESKNYISLLYNQEVGEMDLSVEYKRVSDGKDMYVLGVGWEMLRVKYSSLMGSTVALRIKF